MNRRSFQQLLSVGMVSTLATASRYSDPIMKPQKIKPGNKIGLIAPGSSIPRERIEKSVETVKMLGLVPVLGKYVYEINGFLAGTDQQRLSDLHKMFGDQDIKAIWCIRGGYGCTRLLEDIDYTLIKNNPKILLGYSDITALHLAIQKECNLVTFHGPVASSSPTPYSIAALSAMIFGGDKHLIKMAPAMADSKEKVYSIVAGEAKGTLTGGNLSLLAAMAGTPWCPSYSDKIVFMEDIGEKPYRIDRMLVQLFQSTDLSKAAGIILGQFNDCEGKPGEKTLTLKETLEQQFKKLSIPVFYGFSFGHVEDNCTLPLGIEVSFNTKEKIIRMLESATAD